MNNLLPPIVTTYLAKNGFAKRSVIGDTSKVNCCITIPALSECKNIKILLESLSEMDNTFFHDTLFLFIINNSINASESIKTNNSDTLLFLEGIIKQQNTDLLSLKILNSRLRIAYIDASTLDLGLSNKDGGVGLARKIAMDESLRIFDYTSNLQKLIVSLDADCTVNKYYLTGIRDYFSTHNASAAVVNYSHTAEDNDSNSYAIVCYEIYLRYYELSLRWANSPFAFHTIGSTMVCDTASYVKAEGMNKRKAAEDFYFLSKLSKFCTIHRIKDSTVYPSKRESFRVPFGTGQRVTRFLSNSQNEYELYSPNIFEDLSIWNQLFLSYDFDEHKTEVIPKSILAFLNINNFFDSFAKIRLNSKTEIQLYNQKKKWFDAFKTLKYIHYAKDNFYPSINMFQAINWLFLKYGVDTAASPEPCLDEQRNILNILRKL